MSVLRCIHNAVAAFLTRICFPHSNLIYDFVQTVADRLDKHVKLELFVALLTFLNTSFTDIDMFTHK